MNVAIGVYMLGGCGPPPKTFQPLSRGTDKMLPGGSRVLLATVFKYYFFGGGGTSPLTETSLSVEEDLFAREDLTVGEDLSVGEGDFIWLCGSSLG